MSLIHSSPHNIPRPTPHFSFAPCCPIEPKVLQPIDQKICIIGAGMSGLFAALLLDIAGLKNIEILECQERVGGRVHTEYFSDNITKDKLYGELGAMRLPKGTDVVRYFYNNKRDDSNKIMTQGYATNPENFEKLGFTNSVSNDYRFILLADSLMYYFKILDADINKRIRELLEVGKYSVYSYLKRYLFRRVSYEEDIDQTIGAMK
ncbi:unnamed protein product [Rhizophagus irregularis]|uniref:Amine oxidase domain-containing protein n=1 Tax=Rhizophagus irregularis TaxID=588596 RepID=A0A915Z0H7_9GLOM|nr:unnamed protein product [Rhizophagus irregularis]